jgi:cobalt-zinc-cadmium efflux system membrane fusion protein
VTRLSALALMAAVACSRGPSGEHAGHDHAAAVPAADAGAHPAAAAASGACTHGVPAELCTRCNPDLAPVFKEAGDWCEAHGLPESQCRACNPGLELAATSAAAGEAWCKEHGIEESRCTKCRPQLVATFIQAGDYCREHGYPESACPYCRPERVRALGHALPVFPEPGTKVRLASAATERKAGIETVEVRPRPFARSIEVVGQLEFAQDRLARLSARGDAQVLEVTVDVGDAVRRGDPLVVLASGVVGGAQSRLAAARARVSAARAGLAREESLVAGGVSARRDVEQARAELAQAAGEEAAALAELRAAGAGERGAGGRHVLAAPFDGTVVSRTAVAGRTVADGEVLVEVADVRTLWAVLDVPEEEAGAIRAGQRALVRVDGGGPAREGRVARVAATVDPRTRAVRVRVELPNPDGALRAGAFLRATVEVEEPRAALLVPRDAVQRAQAHDLVFVRTAPGEYEPVNVRLGARAGPDVEIAAGLSPGAHVVTTGAFALKTEILKDSIGAGCADH